MPNPTVGERVKGAQVLAGFDSIEALAQAIDSPGLGHKTLRRIAAGEREARPHELAAIADACGLPRLFFTMDFSELDHPSVKKAREEAEQRIAEARVALQIALDALDKHGRLA